MTRAIVDWIQSLPLPGLFFATLAMSLVGAMVIVASVRIALRLLGYDEGKPLLLRDSAVNTTSALFALTMAFSAAGIWQESQQAHTAVQREANALENLHSIAAGFPPELRDHTRAGIRDYAQQVIAKDWPAMLKRERFDAKIYDESESVLVQLVDAISREAAAAPLPVAMPAIGQIVEARSARLQRITLATQGVTNAQWLAMILLACAALAMLAMVHNSERMSQLLAVLVYTTAASAAFFVVLAHDRPFVGRISVSSEPIAHLLSR
ncbi:hypothetical protein [Pseudorhodoplanes sp.]|uniref:bestrophin-like domain n=1 Tax=Pseudorhodoplanes sp. TaxID=1934341 RepID=UPI002C1CA6C4|nr:hypothetical protein [Pseudorhodoplanes sp.]HWV52069.1 hypothetical protein [Pseudorhodoplanes sp.]